MKGTMPGQSTRKHSFRQEFSSGSGGSYGADFLELYRSRIKMSGAIGFLYIPVNFYLEVVFVRFAPVSSNLLYLGVVRGLWMFMMGAVFLLARKAPLSFRYLRFLDWATYFGSNMLMVWLGAILSGIDNPYFCGLIMMNFMRAFFLPGGLRLFLPIYLASSLGYPAGMLGLSLFMPELGVQLAEPLRLTFFVVNSLLIFACSGVAAICAAVVDRLQREVFKFRKVGRYQIQRKLGQGGMGVVYLAHHGILKRATAIKLLSSERPLDEEARKRFEREALHTAQLTHPNTIQIFDFGSTDDGTLYYAMEYIEGIDLAHLVDRHGVLPPERAIYIMVQACRSLDNAHRYGVIHRDLKPANIMVSNEASQPDHVKVLDFGLAKLLMGSDPAHREETVDVSAVHSVRGTPAYMSPEQCQGEDLDARSDIYSLGCVLYFLLTGRPTFQHESWLKVMMAHAGECPQRLSEVNAAVPADLEAVVMRCLAKNPDDRYQSAVELKDALRRCQDHGLWGVEEAEHWWVTARLVQKIDTEYQEEEVDMAVQTTMHVPITSSRSASELLNADVTVRDASVADARKKGQLLE